GLTNAWYTTIHRDPFEPDPVSGIGPRWRLKANKFGQDIPGLEIPAIECSPVPFTSENIKYEVGEPTVTTINLLDWNPTDDIPVSPLLTSRGWIDSAANLQNLDPAGVPDAENGISINGLPLTADFDLAVYIKGDKKPTSIFNARLEIVYEGEGGGVEPPDTEFDMAITEFKVPSKVRFGDTRKIRTTIANFGPDIASGMLEIVGTLDDVVIETQTFEFGPMAPGESERNTFDWLADNPSGTVTWTATVVADGDTDLANNSFAASTIIR
ncbi:MAG: CARDB domain-containing protein, partial [Gammaproteobacteria bacterium]